VADNVVSVLAGVAERGEEIDVDRARLALSTARERLATEGPATLSRPEGTTDEPASGPSSSRPPSGPDVPLTGAMLALLAPSSAEAAVRRAEVRLDAAGARPET